MTGDVAPLSYVPLLNPLDIVQLFVLLMLGRAGESFEPCPPSARRRRPRAPAFALAALGFVWLNARCSEPCINGSRYPGACPAYCSRP